MKRAIALPVLALLATTALAGCEQPGQPGPMQRAGAAVDQGMANAGQNLGQASVATGNALNRAGQAVGGAAQRTGNYVNDKLAPAPDGSAANPTSVNQVPMPPPSPPAAPSSP